MRQFIRSNWVYAVLIMFWSFVTICVIGGSLFGKTDAIDYKIIAGGWIFLFAVSLKSPFVRYWLLSAFYQLLVGKEDENMLKYTHRIYPSKNKPNS